MADTTQPSIDTNLVDKTTTWKSLGLDGRLLRAIDNLHWTNPSLVQSKSIPMALKGKDVLAKARTGSGKTASYAIPIIQRILNDKESGETRLGTRALILVPTRDLCDQVTEVFQKLTHYCPHLVRYIHIGGDVPTETQKHRLAELPDVLISTPGKLVTHLDKKNVNLANLQMIVIDEADLILSYGYKADVDKIAKHLPNICQGFMMSATLNDEVEALKKAILHTPVVLKLEEEQKVDDNLHQFVVNIAEPDKHLLLYALLKLGLIKGKTLIFVNSIDRCFKLKLFLERLSIKSAVLNSDLPQNSRYHIVQQFNKGVFDLLLATDEKHKEAGKADDDDLDSEEEAQKSAEAEEKAESDDSDDDSLEGEEFDPEQMKVDEKDLSEEESDEEEANGKAAKAAKAKKADKSKQQDKKAEEAPVKQEEKKKSAKGSKTDEEYGVARGMDFQGVTTVVNFDFPRSSKNYVHRVGRTARAGKAGIALSFVTEADYGTFEKVQLRQTAEKRQIKPYTFKLTLIEGFRYRVDDILGGVSKHQIKEARYQELRNEMLNSEKLKGYFQEHKTDLDTLKHTKPLQSNRVLTHLKHIPDYLMPSKQEKAEALPELTDDVTDEEYAASFGVKLRRGKRKRNVLQEFSYTAKGFKAPKNKRQKTTETMMDSDGPQATAGQKKTRKR